MLKMGLFGNYAKEGPGVKKNEPQKKRFFYFFELYFRKFGKLMTLSLLYSAFYPSHLYYSPTLYY